MSSKQDLARCTRNGQIRIQTWNSKFEFDYSSYLTNTYLTFLQYSELQIWIRQGEVHSGISFVFRIYLRKMTVFSSENRYDYPRTQMNNRKQSKWPSWHITQRSVFNHRGDRGFALLGSKVFWNSNLLSPDLGPLLSNTAYKLGIIIDNILSCSQKLRDIVDSYLPVSPAISFDQS